MAGPSRGAICGGSLIAKKYRLLGQIDEGSFGIICLGKDVESREQVAIKIESQHSTQPRTLLQEARLLKALHRVSEDGKAVRMSLTKKIKLQNVNGFVNVLSGLWSCDDTKARFKSRILMCRI